MYLGLDMSLSIVQGTPISSISERFCSKVNGPTDTKLHVEPHRIKWIKLHWNSVGNMTKTSAMLIYGKTIKKFWNRKANVIETWYTAFLQMMILG